LAGFDLSFESSSNIAKPEINKIFAIIKKMPSHFAVEASYVIYKKIEIAI